MRMLILAAGDASSRQADGIPLPRNGMLERLAGQRFGPKARQVILLLHQNPGLNIDELAASMGVRRTAANHHVRILERAGLVVRLRQARHQLHFTSDTTSFERAMLRALRVASVQDVARLLFHGTAPSTSALADALNVTPRTTRRALRLLSNQGLLRIEHQGDRKVAHLHPHLRLVLARAPVAGDGPPQEGPGFPAGSP